MVRPLVEPPAWLAPILLTLQRLGREGLGGVRDVLRWASAHTGLPVVVCAALALVLAWRVAKRTWHIALELALALGLLLLATQAGWIRW